MAGRKLLGAMLVALGVSAGAPAARADPVAGDGGAGPLPRAPRVEQPIERSVDPARVGGIDRRALEPGDPQLDALSALLFVPRRSVELLFAASGTAAGLVRDQQVVPRVEELLSPRPGEISIFPLLLLDTRRAPSVGVRMLASGDNTATGVSLGFGGVHDLYAESRIRVGRAWPIPFVFSVEGLADIRSSLDYLGLGQDPETDKRNRFRKHLDSRQALYSERRERVTGSLGVRVVQDLEIFASASFTRSNVADPPDGGLRAISNVFLGGTVPGAPGESRILYSELALRLDTRPTLGRPSPGWLVEGYGGVASGVGDDPTHFFRAGGRAAGFFPVLRRSNIISPKLVIDGMVIPPGAVVPFTELVAQPEFRGSDTRRDKLSLLASLDYRWALTRFAGMRLFTDVVTVAPDFASVFKAAPRFAVGFGLDLYSASTELGQAAIAFSPDGVRVLFSFGVPTSFGDRQHRY